MEWNRHLNQRVVRGSTQTDIPLHRGEQTSTKSAELKFHLLWNWVDLIVTKMLVKLLFLQRFSKVKFYWKLHLKSSKWFYEIGLRSAGNHKYVDICIIELLTRNGLPTNCLFTMVRVWFISWLSMIISDRYCSHNVNVWEQVHLSSRRSST